MPNTSKSLIAPKTPLLRVTTCHDVPPRQEGATHVLYWMIAQRRPHHNFALQYAAEQAHELGLPLVIFEPLRVDYEWASDRFHRFVIDGMRDHRAYFDAHKGVLYYPYLEPSQGKGKGLLKALSEHATLVVTDEFPSFFLPSMVRAAAKKMDVRMVQVDSNGLMPLRGTERIYTTAYSFRRGLHKLLPNHLEAGFPFAEPLNEVKLEPVPKALEQAVLAIQQTWPAPDDECLDDRDAAQLADFPISHDVHITQLEGGFEAAHARLKGFIKDKLQAYPEDRNKPAVDGASGMSPYLHFGHMSAHEIFAQLCKSEGWDPSKIAQKPTGQRAGWWGMSEAAEAFVDELITWREIGYNLAHHEPVRYSTYDELPDFARKTLDDHRHDERPYLYELEEFERAETHDRIWNAAQNQLVQTGSMHNYLRMLWGKKIIEWTPSPEEAAEVMIELNNKYALDGRNPNSYSGIFWCLGRYDRGWQERDIFGKIRFMSSDSTARKYKLNDYLARYAPKKASTTTD